MQAHGDPVDPACQIRDAVAEQLFKASATMRTVCADGYLSVPMETPVVGTLGYT